MKLLTYIWAPLAETFSGLNVRSASTCAFLLLVISLFFVELPPWLLDLLLVSNLLLSILLLLRGLFMDSPLRVYSFPTMLVLTTLLRLSLNVSSTKLILLHGNEGLDAAGKVIEGFGRYVVGNNPLVGGIVFAIIAVVNFVVVAKGSGRVAEVSARFALDALPGRQLAIDAELRTGTISVEEAALRRENLNRESQFYGSMDGAMKWVQGDAVAGLVITFINFVGGVGVGLKGGLSFSQALETFGILTIGDGLVTILPSLLVSVAAGVIITHVSGNDRQDSSEELFNQLLSDPRPPVLASLALMLLGSLGLFGIIEFPFLPFFAVAFLMLLSLARLRALTPQRDSVSISLREADRLRLPTGGRVQALPQADGYSKELSEYAVEELCLRVDSRLLGPYLGAKNGRLDSHSAVGERRAEQFYGIVSQLREQTYKERGIILPELVIQVDEKLAPGSYQVQVREQLVRQGVLRGDQVLVVANAATLAVFGIDVISPGKNPLDQRASMWVEARQSGLEAIRHLGVEIYNPAQFLVLESVGSAFEVIEEIFGLDETKALLHSLDYRHASLHAAVFEAPLISYAECTELLRRLLRERVNIRDLKLILEGIAEFSALNNNTEDRQEWISELHSFLRLVLARTIVNDALGPGDKLRTFILSSEIEEEFRSAISLWDQSRSKPPLDPGFEISLRESANRIFTPVLERGSLPIVVICPADIRPAVQDFFGRQLGNSDCIRTLAYQELNGHCKPESIGVVTVSN